MTSPIQELVTLARDAEALVTWLENSEIELPYFVNLTLVAMKERAQRAVEKVEGI